MWNYPPTLKTVLPNTAGSSEPYRWVDWLEGLISTSPQQPGEPLMQKHFLLVTAVSMLLASAAIAQPTAPSAPIKPTQSPAVPGKALSTGEAASPLGAIHRSNPIVVPPPEPNSAEQSYSRGSGFASQYGTKPDPKVTSAPPATGRVGTNTLVGGVGADAAPGDAGKTVFSGDKASKVTPAPSPATQAGQQGKR